MSNPLRPLFIAALLALSCAAPAAAQTKLLRFPDVHGGRVVFSYAGDLWTAPLEGGAAVRLTAHPGLELFPKFSPDGRTIAFTSQYDGDEQVYVMPATGGVPQQLTFYPAQGPLPARWGYDNQVYGWTPDGTRVLFRSLRDGWSVAQSRLYTVAVAGGLPDVLPMPTSGAGDYAPDGTSLVYSPLFRDFRTWKRYEGGWAQDLYVFDLASRQTRPVAHSPRTERDPMWIGTKIYFTSDRTGTLNLYEFDPASDQTRPLTTFTDWDVRWPGSSPDGTIVFERDGELHAITTAPGATPRRIPITVPDDGLASRPARITVGGQVQGFGLSPKGERALFVARGDVFTAPIEKGVPRNLTRSSGAHDKAATWSPDGRQVAYLSDASGEEELYVVAQDGSGPPTRLTTDGSMMRFRPVWSPDSRRIALSDKEGRIQVVTIADRAVQTIANEPSGQVLDYVWAPDSAHLAYSLSDDNTNRSVWIWSAADGQARRVTSALFNEYAPAWDPDGRYLYFLSDREFAPLLSSIEWNFALSRETGVYALALRRDVAHPFPPESDEVTIAPDDAETKDGAETSTEAKADAKKNGAGQAPAREGAWVTIDFDGIEDRVARAPVPPQNLSGLEATPDGLVYTRLGNPYYGRSPDAPPALVLFTFKDRKEHVLQADVNGWTLAAEGRKVIVRQGSSFHMLEVKPNPGADRKTIATETLAVDRVPRDEWQQIFGEVWRRYRDYFYVENMHGYDWDALRRQYEALVAHVRHRADLNYVIGEMIAELNVGHAYIAGGDYEVPDRPRVALPGARLALDAASGRYRIARIMRGHNEEPAYRSPLTEVGVDVVEGMYVLAIDGLPLTRDTNPYRLLRGKAGRPVRLSVASAPDAEGREVVFEPIADETKLVYLDMVLTNRARVEERSGGRLGYLHVPDMGADGIYEFIKWYYPQLRKDGLVVDVRGNGGGNVSRMLVERLRRELLATGFARTSERTTTYPDGVFVGPMACLLNENSASDGDIFPAMFREAGLGPLIGRRSWGGVVGITNRGSLIDGGTVNVPEFGFASAAGEWIIEGAGVTPDIVVDNDPAAVIDGRDPQLERAIDEVLAALPDTTHTLPDRPAPPVKTGK